MNRAPRWKDKPTAMNGNRRTAVDSGQGLWLGFVGEDEG
ncbi:hypothetical protein LOK49_LG10G01640 [Camellia lanceoleosa]|uniref:Uncharacterized protein n=1 Tax=Camellia lanceoleosa TaxID=1840588 RepID=A0ACC0G4Z9_9ERIC|nr:hypothetical protein LOK49_LG10G01640 [Camellia lanceoleosa]